MKSLFIKFLRWLIFKLCGEKLPDVVKKEWSELSESEKVYFGTIFVEKLMKENEGKK